MFFKKNKAIEKREKNALTKSAIREPYAISGQKVEFYPKFGRSKRILHGKERTFGDFASSLGQNYPKADKWLIFYKKLI